MTMGFLPKYSPQIRLRNFFQNPYNDAIAAARTCYSSQIIHAEEITPQQQDSIGPLTFSAGHHTVFQHATFEFSIENVSRHFVWSTLHSFSFYNSDQQSQRYVDQKNLRVFVPPLESPNVEIYEKAVSLAFETYSQLTQILEKDTLRILQEIRKLPASSLEREAHKKAMELARYVLPISTLSSLVYTCSGLVLYRLRKLISGGDVPFETQKVVEEMIREVEKVEPLFFSKIQDSPFSTLDLPETQMQTQNPEIFSEEAWTPFQFSKLIHFTTSAESILETSARFALGIPSHHLSQEEILSWIFDPSKNIYRTEALNLFLHSPLMRTLAHVHYVFQKRLSHSADSQNQRHRTVLGSRPLLSSLSTAQPDFYTPPLIQQNPQAKELYEACMAALWKAKNNLIENNVSREFSLYLLPNAVRIRFIESGSLLNLLTKWMQRTCLNAQEEIYQASMEEIQQVLEVHPFLKERIGPPCFLRKNLSQPKCTEGKHFCGVPLWNLFPHYQRKI